MIEWDSNLPPLAVLLEEAQRADAVAGVDSSVDAGERHEHIA
ncbi:MAG: DUF692 domain-containing protein [Gammaproteobacteria bacterium]|nr:DUF692 domain-containing protein [Gammaproteobacteria bacterium]